MPQASAELMGHIAIIERPATPQAIVRENISVLVLVNQRVNPQNPHIFDERENNTWENPLCNVSLL